MSRRLDGGSKTLRAVLAAGLAVLVLGGTGVSWSRLEGMSGSAAGDGELLYLPDGRLLQVMSLGQSSLLADAVYLWAIQYYSNYEIEDRYRYVEHVFDRVITELDPHYIDAYWLGALILIIEARELEAGLRLLEKGADRNPDEWILPYLAAWECYHAGQYERAGAWFARASQVPGVPPGVLRMRAGMLSKAGNLPEALEFWRGLLDDPGSDGATVNIAERQVRELRIRIDVGGLETAVARFRDENGRNPRSLEELQVRSYIELLPRDPDGREYRYDPEEGIVSSGSGRVLRGD